MENASKALIIAGAILLAILIISLGIMIYGQARGVINDSAMSELEIKQFNEKFTQYEGDRVRGATVNSLIQTVIAHNGALDDDSRGVAITCSNIPAGEPQITLTKGSTTVSNKAKTGRTYKVTCTYETNNGKNKGLINSINIEQV